LHQLYQVAHKLTTLPIGTTLKKI